MSLAPGRRLGPYEILSALGAGGMGEVYRAKDTRLDRLVAIKVLPSHLTASEEARQRFDREARAISSLSHPHICALHDVGHQEGVDFLVMEYLEGESLADRLEKGPLPPDQVLRVAVEIASALDRAHRQGLVHRDLKPANVMLTRSGAKLLDFGLAKLQDAGPSSPGAALSSLATGARSLTAEGTILGTFAYMAPEQLEGKEADARTDIFAFGALLYEMATGRRAFEGKSQASLISAIMSADPQPISSIRPMTPPALDRLVKICLAKDPDERWQTAHDLSLQLAWIAEGGSQAGLPAPVAVRRRRRERLWMGATLLSALAAVLLGFLLIRSMSHPVRALQASILPPEKGQFDFNSGSMALSPDGLRLATVAAGPDGKRQIWVRLLAASGSQPLAGTEGATYPFWSPDGRSLGFFAAGKLRKIDISGGPPESLCDAPNGRGGTWSPEGVIVFAPALRGPLHRVSSAGGKSVPATVLDEESKQFRHQWPRFLPDGRHFLFLGQTPNPTGEARGSGIYVGSLDSQKSEFILAANSNALYAPPGFLLFWREGTLMAQPFDPAGRRLTGDASPVAERVQHFTGRSDMMASVSDTGILVYEGGVGTGLSQLTWFDRSGRKIEEAGAPGNYYAPRLSPDTRRIAYDLSDGQDLGDIWIYDVARKLPSRFTFDPANDTSPVWSPDGSRIVFNSSRKGAGDLYLKPVAGIGSEEPLLASDLLKFPSSWSADGKHLVFQSFDPKGKAGWDLWVFSLNDRKATPLLQSEFNEQAGSISPDGRWLAYVSNESGNDEIYLQSFPGPGGKWQVSTGGGSIPRWRGDGKELYYLSPGNKIMAVALSFGSAPEAGIPAPLFEVRVKGSGREGFDVSPDGRRFLVNLQLSGEDVEPITLLENWTASLRR